MAQQGDDEERAEFFRQIKNRKPGTFVEGEEWWRDHYQWIYDSGYKLRDRYKLDWTPSWFTTGAQHFNCVDGHANWWEQLMDSTRLSDGRMVALKIVSRSKNPQEIEMTKYLSSEPLASDPRNHSVPLYDVLEVPDDQDLSIMVIPHLRSFLRPSFSTVGEGVEFFRQIFEGLQFLHNNHVAHRDCMDLNIMMDGSTMFPDGYYPIPIDPDMRPDFKGPAKYFTRTERPPKYYFIDFGIARRYDPDLGPPLELPIWGGDKTVPEFQKSDKAMNPFPTDIYYLGNAIREHFLELRSGFEFMQPLVNEMIQSDPSKRPTIDEIVARFDALRRSLSSWKLRSRAVEKDEYTLLRLSLSLRHLRQRIGYVLKRIPPVPVP